MAPASVLEQERRALAHLQQGNHAEAEHLLRALLAGGKARASTALNLAGLCTRDGRWQEALDLLETALSLDPAYAAAHFNRGNVQRVRGDLDAAVASYRRALELQADFPGAVPLLAQTLCEQGDHAAAAALLGQALDRQPEEPELHFLLGNALLHQGDPTAAAGAYRQALTLRAAFPEAHCNLGNACQQLGQSEGAIAAYRQALALLPTFAEASFNLANVLREQGSLAEAIQLYRQTLAHNPNQPEACCNLGNTLRESGDPAGAVAAYRQALQLKDDFAEAHSNLGATLQQLGDVQAAITAFRHALVLRPHYPEALSNLGNALEELGEHTEAVEVFEQAIAQQHDYADAHFNLGLTLLHTGAWARGWEEYEWRWRRRETQNDRLSTARPLWQPGSSGRVLAWGEQGIGDVVMFASQIPQLHLLCDALTVRTDARLLPLFRRSFHPDIRFKGQGDPLGEEEHDHHIPLGSLGRFLRRKPLAFQAAAAGFLRADASRAAALRRRLLGEAPGRLIGVSWRSSVKRSPAREKSLPLLELAATLGSLDARLLTLQYGDTDTDLREVREQQGLELATAADIDLFHDLDGLAALIEACDVVVTISNVTAHLAGALGKPTLLLVPHNCDWRWGHQGETTQWYDAVTVLRQGQPADWSGPLLAVARLLG
ncbi:tetratricopeptide repeat protein [Cyanobium sp. NIES-981]|uniref:tetratricopeptide repeat protein n=1 Tax=Cyanobium sp. NIES-981 TaxID=1851505 RepID=UPI0007DCC3D4|nr:tetratricopeptide repeat protein [Cyanobium sp. NIES-981]SBO44985.1 conserved protein of unknown function [Cyanobium sp. NIES-981]